MLLSITIVSTKGFADNCVSPGPLDQDVGSESNGIVRRRRDHDRTKERRLMTYFLKRVWGTREETGYALGRFYAEQGLAWFRPVADGEGHR